MFVGAGSVNLKYAALILVARCFVSLSGTKHSSGSLPDCLSSLPEQFRARSGTGTTPLVFPKERAEQGELGPGLHVHPFRRTRRDYRPGFDP